MIKKFIKMLKIALKEEGEDITSSLLFSNKIGDFKAKIIAKSNGIYCGEYVLKAFSKFNGINQVTC